MKKTILCLAAVCAAVPMIFAAGCSEEKNTRSDTSAVQSAAAEKPSPDELADDIVGYWGRLGEVMHEFYDDGTCVVGGMFGDFTIDENGDLIMTTTSGSDTRYVWGDFTQPNYWELDGNTLTVNGNQFTRITETPD